MSFYTHDITLAKSDAVVTHGLSDVAFNNASAAVEKALHRLREEAKAGTLALLTLPALQDDLTPLIALATRLREQASDIVILGTGGSSLGGQTLAQLADHGVPGLSVLRKGLRLHFMDNLDPITFTQLLEALPLDTTRFIAISKSGGTGETLMQTIAVVEALQKASLPVAYHVFGLSEPQKPDAKRNGLRALLEPFDVMFLEHHTGVGGRYSVLSNVGLLPAALLDVNVQAIREGAAQVLEACLDGVLLDANPVTQGAVLNLAAMNQGKSLHVMMAYGDRFALLMKWWVQLWAESIGKDGKGSQPVAALAPVDQHSQLQLYLAGPKDKLFTVITTDVAGQGTKLSPELSTQAGEPDFGNRTIGDLVAAQGRATADTLAKNGCPTRRIHVPQINENAFGALLMHFMLETILVGYALGIDPFDQPAVEEGKILAKAYLKAS